MFLASYTVRGNIFLIGTPSISVPWIFSMTNDDTAVFDAMRSDCECGEMEWAGRTGTRDATKGVHQRPGLGGGLIRRVRRRAKTPALALESAALLKVGDCQTKMRTTAASGLTHQTGAF